MGMKSLQACLSLVLIFAGAPNSSSARDFEPPSGAAGGASGCDGKIRKLENRIDNVDEDIDDLNAELREASGSEKSSIANQIAKAKAKRQDLRNQLRKLEAECD